MRITASPNAKLTTTNTVVKTDPKNFPLNNPYGIKAYPMTTVVIDGTFGGSTPVVTITARIAGDLAANDETFTPWDYNTGAAAATATSKKMYNLIGHFDQLIFTFTGGDGTSALDVWIA